MADIIGLKVKQIETYNDKRGSLYSLYRYDFDDLMGDLEYVEDRISIGHKGVLRGLHGDSDCEKLIICLHGSFQLVVIDARKDSETRGNVFSSILYGKRPTVVKVPAGCLNGHLVFEDDTILLYKWSHFYDGPDGQSVLNWDNEVLYNDMGDLPWFMASPYILSERDSKKYDFKDIQL